MSERSSPADWERWQADWQQPGAAAATARDAPRHIARARRGLLLVRLIETAVAGAAILVTAAALRHAGNPFEAGLGLVVGVSIAALWIQRMRLREKADAAVAASSPQHLAVLESVGFQQIRLAHFIWIVLSLELAFLTPWWVIGSRVHHRSLTDPGSWLSVWLPIVGMVALFVWSWRLRRRAWAELQDIELLRAQYRDPDAAAPTFKGG
jgi:hypothetical protein